MATSVQETERKYEAPAGSDLPPLDGFPGVAAEAGPERIELEAVYYDTADLRLARGGVTLRRRTGGDDAGWHLKLPVGEDTREEVRLPLGRAKKPPQELASLVQVHARGAELKPVARIRTTRKRWQLVDTHGELLVEVVEDLVSAQVLVDSADDPSTADSWREIEVELGERGDRELLDVVERRLYTAGIRRSTSSAKLTRLLADRLVPAPPGPRTGRKATTGDVVLAYLTEHAAALKHHDPAVRREEPDAVHKMRVSTRRLRSALQAYGKIVDREQTRELANELKWLAGVLGEARDLEVLRERFTEAVSRLDPDLVLGPVSARLTRHFAPLEKAAHQNSVAALNSGRYFALLDSIDALLAAPPLTPPAAERAVKAMPKLVEKSYRRLADRAREVLDTPAGHERDLALHESRKAAKRLRYTTEAAEAALGKRATAYRNRVKDVQTLLGEHQDGVVARPALRELAVQAQLDGENGFTFGLLHGLESGAATRVEERFPAVWGKVGKPKLS
jgi:CHAD domain-containing protein